MSVPSVTAGEQFWVLVQGADATQMGTGNYALGLNFKGAAPPVEASPIVAVPNGNPNHCGSGQADGSNGNGPYVEATPVVTGITPDNGVSSQDGITNSPNIAILGSAAAADTITFYCNGNVIGQTTAQQNNTFTYNLPNKLNDGVYEFTVMATDPAGFATPVSYAYQVTIDTHVPSPPNLNDVSPDTGASNTDGITNAENPTFSGGSEPFAVINLYSNGKSKPFATTEADINGNWSYTIPGGGWGDGTYNVTATQMDVAGTTSASSAPLTAVIDTQQPQEPKVTGISPDTGKSNDGITTARNLTISGTAQAGTTVSVFLNGGLLGATVAGTTDAWTFDNTAMTLANGNYTITAQATDIAGNVSNLSNTFNVTVETVQPPVIAGVSLNTQGSGQQSLSIGGTAAPNNSVQVSLNGAVLGTVNANGQGSWNYTYVPSSNTVASGVYGVSAIAIDQSLNVSAASPTFQLSVGGGLTASTPLYSSGTLSGYATPGSLVTIVDGDIILGVVVVNASGDWQFTPALSKGNNSIMVEVTNSAGYTSLLSGALSVNV